MPRQEHNVGRQRSTKFEICANGLLTMRGRQLQAVRMGRDPAKAQANIDAIDHVLTEVIGYQGNIEEDSRDFRRVSTFKRGELRNVVADILRKANRPLTTLEIAKQAHAPKGIEVSYSRKIKNRVTIVLHVLKKMPSVERGKDAEGYVVWATKPLF